MPAPVVADALGDQHVTTTRFASQSGTTWSRYAPGDHTQPPAGAYGTMSGGGSTILSYHDHADPDDVFLEYAGGVECVDNADDVQKFVMSFHDIATSTALTPEQTVELIEQLAINLEKK